MSSTPLPLTSIVLGTRRSKLARVQTDMVVAKLAIQHPTLEVKVHAMDPLGDRDKNTALYKFGEKSLWTGELEELLEKGDLGGIVHSLKDMPTTLPPDLILGAILTREDPRDALVLKANSPYATTSSAAEILKSLPPGSIIGTSSLRRIAQLKRLYPHLAFANARGNVPTRVQKLDSPDSFTDQQVPQYTGLVLAAAGLIRLGLGARISAFLSSKEGGVLHAVGQGGIGVEMRGGDDAVWNVLGGLSDKRTWWACLAERALMRALEGGCSVPIGVETEWTEKENGDAELLLRGIVVSLEGDEAVEAEEVSIVRNDEDADTLGKKVAEVLVQKGAGKILDVINQGREKEQEEMRTKYEAVHHDGVSQSQETMA